MDSEDQAGQWRALRETYDHMDEDELCRVASDAYDLVPLAREVLQAVIKERGLAIPLAADPTTDKLADGATDPETSAPDGDELVSVRKLHSRSEAELAKSILDANFIASCLGPDEIVDLNDFTGSFDHGVDLWVFARDARRASSRLDEFAPEEMAEKEIEEEKATENDEYVIACPKCHSQEVILDATDQGAKTEVIAEKFNWTCADCGHQWQDDGIEQAV